MSAPTALAKVPPAALQDLLLNALLLPREQARAAAEQWLAGADMDAIEQASMRFMPLFYDRLRELGIDHPLLPLMKGIKKRAWFLNSMLMRRAAEALRALNAAGIEALALKGTALTLAYYHDLSLRPMSDVDLMVRPGDAAAAIRVLCAGGWKLDTGNLRADRFLQRARRYGHAVNLVHPAGQAIDLHWNLLPYSADPDLAFWERSHWTELDGERVRVLSSTDEFLHACAHGASWNEVAPIRWATDALFILRNGQPIDWEILVAEARKRRLTLVTEGAIDRLQRQFAAGVPAAALAALRHSPSTLFERLEYAQLRKPTSGLFGYVPRRLFKFHRLMHNQSAASAFLSLPDYLCWACNTEHIGQLPHALVRRMIRRTRSEAPA